MKFNGRFAILAVGLAVLAPRVCLGVEQVARRLPKPPQRGEHPPKVQPEVRRIPLPLPTAPLPDGVRASLPTALPAPVTGRIAAQAEAVPPEPPPMPEDFTEVPVTESAVTLMELEDVALANNPTIVQAAMRVRAAQGKRVQAGLYPNPSVGYSAEDMGLEGSAGKQGAFFGQEIVTAGKLRLRSAVFAREAQQAQCALEAQRRRVLNDVRNGWYEVLIAQQVVGLNRRIVDIGQQGVRAAADLLRGQEVSRVDLLQAQIEADTARLLLRDARNRHQAAWRQTAAVIGRPDMELVTLSGDLRGEMPEFNWGDTLQYVLYNSPELAEALAGVSRAQCAVYQENAERIPNFEVQTVVHYDNATDDTVGGIELAVALPIFNRNQGNIHKARAELIAARNEVQRTRLALQQRLAEAFEKQSNARHQVVKYADEILPNAGKSLELVQVGYREDEFDFLTLLIAQRTYYRVHLAYFDSLLEYHRSRIAIEGFLLAGALGEKMMNDE